MLPKRGCLEVKLDIFKEEVFLWFLLISKIPPTKCPLAKTFGLLRDQKSFNRLNIHFANMPALMSLSEKEMWQPQKDLHFHEVKMFDIARTLLTWDCSFPLFRARQNLSRKCQRLSTLTNMQDCRRQNLIKTQTLSIYLNNISKTT